MQVLAQIPYLMTVSLAAGLDAASFLQVAANGGTPPAEETKVAAIDLMKEQLKQEEGQTQLEGEFLKEQERILAHIVGMDEIPGSGREVARGTAKSDTQVVEHVASGRVLGDIKRSDPWVAPVEEIAKAEIDLLRERGEQKENEAHAAGGEPKVTGHAARDGGAGSGSAMEMEARGVDEEEEHTKRDVAWRAEPRAALPVSQEGRKVPAAAASAPAIGEGAVPALPIGFLTGSGGSPQIPAAWAKSQSGAGYEFDTTSPLSSISDLPANSYLQPVPVDLDSDGDYDIVVGDQAQYGTSQILSAYRNNGTTLQKDDTLLDGFAGTSVQLKLDTPVPSFVDLDGDGDFDMVIGGGSNQRAHFENIGSATVPKWALRAWQQGNGNNEVHGSSPFTIVPTFERMQPSFVDLDGDGDMDFYMVYNYGANYYENIGTATSPQFENRHGTSGDPFSNIQLDGTGLGASFADLDGDGDFDVVYNRDGYAYVHRNDGTSTSPAFSNQRDSVLEAPFNDPDLRFPNNQRVFGSGRRHSEPPRFLYAAQNKVTGTTGTTSTTTSVTGTTGTSTTVTGTTGTATLTTAAVDPNDQASVVGDPHVISVARAKFEIRAAGVHKLVQIPQVIRSNAKPDLRVDAEIRHLVSHDCGKSFMTSLTVFGRWTEDAFGLLRISPGSDAPNTTLLVNTQLPEEFFKQFPRPEVKAGRESLTFKLQDVAFHVGKHYEGRYGEQRAYLNVRIAGLKKYKDLGGLLGYDDHGDAEKPSADCAAAQPPPASRSSFVGSGRSAPGTAGGSRIEAE